MRESVGPAVETTVLLQACIPGLQSTVFHWFSGEWAKDGFPKISFGPETVT